MPGIRPAQAILNEIRNGALMNDLASHLHDATTAAQEQGKKATVTVTIEIAPQTKNMTDPTFVIFGEVTSKLPKPDVPGTVFGLDEDANLSRNFNRAQSGLNLTFNNKTGTGGSDGGS